MGDIALKFSSFIRHNILFRLAEVEDAEFILELRNDPYKSRHLHPIGPSVSDQVDWLREYKLRELSGKEFYFIIEDCNGERFGTYRVYDINSQSAVCGSWVFKSNSPKNIAIIADLTLKEYFFTEFGISDLFFETRKKNKRIVAYSNYFNPTVIKEDNLYYYFHLNYQNFLKGKYIIIELLSLGID